MSGRVTSSASSKALKRGYKKRVPIMHDRIRLKRASLQSVNFNEISPAARHCKDEMQALMDCIRGPVPDPTENDLRDDLACLDQHAVLTHCMQSLPKKAVQHGAGFYTAKLRKLWQDNATKHGGSFGSL
eukprot:gnl/Hemi2/9052_TR3131_c0_g1_i1.p3 gnl/Hemi2/9052_TR3131_c0_g1~~gnl/Hemi2/9052_TR3131_c0_g1_i1.p3  ORF type:complete len:129 (-),score=57.38 gnl/Hemi2/9052_TR3131_c0_g1_i1:120-506(-)